MGKNEKKLKKMGHRNVLCCVYTYLLILPAVSQYASQQWVLVCEQLTQPPWFQIQDQI